jgi:hypothetical protein
MSENRLARKLDLGEASRIGEVNDDNLQNF